MVCVDRRITPSANPPYELNRNQANAGLVHQIAHIWIPVLAIACFVAGVVLPVIGGLDSLGSQQPTQNFPGKKR